MFGVYVGFGVGGGTGAYRPALPMSITRRLDDATLAAANAMVAGESIHIADPYKPMPGVPEAELQLWQRFVQVSADLYALRWSQDSCIHAYQVPKATRPGHAWHMLAYPSNSVRCTRRQLPLSP